MKSSCLDRQQDQQKSDLLCGRKPVLELLEREPEKIDMLWLRKGKPQPETQTILDLCRAASVRFLLCDPQILDRLAGRGIQHQGVIARIFSAGFADFSTLLDSGMHTPLPLLLALDRVQDAGNAGTLARTLYALGGAGLVIPGHNGVYLGAAARRAAAGALEQIPVAKVVNLSRALLQAKKAGWQVYGTSVSADSTNLFAAKLFLPAILVLGSEEKGLSLHMREKCDTLLHIPMPREFDSLNVAQAGAIIIAAFAKNQFLQQ